MELGFDFGSALVWIVLFPLFGALINGVAGRFADKETVKWVALGSVAMSFVLAVLVFVLELVLGRMGHEGHGGVSVSYTAYEWFRITVGHEQIPIQVRFVMDELSGVMTLVVTGIGFLIHLYASSYMHDDPGFSRFFTYLNLFTASMLILVLASNLPLMFVGWEGVGLCSYLLIGFWYENSAYAAAGKKAFIVNRIGDFGVLLGMFFLVVATHSFEFEGILAAQDKLLSGVVLNGNQVGMTVATAAALCLFLGCTGKSAQIPLYVWLPDAMAGPTPVSALIHAATMVTSGIYLCCRLSGVFVASQTAMTVIAVVGALTAFSAASVALVQNQMKKILAYSTVSQLGFMFAAVGVGAFGAGIFHVFTHAFFKACLFLGAGSVMHAVHAHGDADIRVLGGLKKWLPTTQKTFFWSCLAIAGVPVTSGFFSKDEILLGAVTGHLPYGLHWVVFGLLALTAFMTAFYMFRLYYRTFEGEYRGGGAPHEEHHGGHDAHDDHAHHGDPHESPPAMTGPLLILGGGALVVGFLGIPHWWLPESLHAYSLWGTWLHPRLAEATHEIPIGRAVAAMAMGTLAGLGGWLLARTWYFSQKGETPANIAKSAGALTRLLEDRLRVDELYEHTVVAAAQFTGRFAANFDRSFVDGILAYGTSNVTRATGWVLTRAQNGLVQAYAAVMVIGLAVVLWWVAVPHTEIRFAVDGTHAALSAPEGLGYEYRWDLNDDGAFETEWSASGSRVEHNFQQANYARGAAVMNVYPFRDREELRLSNDHWVVLDVSGLGPDWARPDVKGAPVPPSIRWELEEAPAPVGGDEDEADSEAAHSPRGVLVLRPNDATVFVRGEQVRDPVRLEPGSVAEIGRAILRVAAVVRANVEVRNAFGGTGKGSADILLDFRPRPAAHAALDRGAQ